MTEISSSDFRKRAALRICRKYIDDKQANNLQVNISSKSRTTVLAGLPQSGRLMFECAQEEVFQLMKAGNMLNL